MLKGKKILIGITGSIAAYKTLYLIRLFMKAGAHVRVVITPAAKEFVPILTLSVLSKNKVLCDLADEDTWANHVALGRWADVMLIAPLSCNTLAKMANGHCDNLLLAVYLSATCPVVVAPAMDEDMWHHTATKQNIAKLSSYNNLVIGVGDGELASGLIGEGRMAEPEAIIIYVEEHIFRQKTLAGKLVLLTAGPTQEAIDPVRYISNHSSGKMGMAIAEEIYMRGANVHLILGPVTITPRYKGISVHQVTTAAQMYDQAVTFSSNAAIAILTAAVADYTPTVSAAHKIKKSHDSFLLNVQKTKDILMHIGHNKKAGQIVVGFALETENGKENALYKLEGKNADIIVLNTLTAQNEAFGSDTNKVTIFDNTGFEKQYESKTKDLVARDIVDFILTKLP